MVGDVLSGNSINVPLIVQTRTYVFVGEHLSLCSCFVVVQAAAPIEIDMERANWLVASTSVRVDAFVFTLLYCADRFKASHVQINSGPFIHSSVRQAARYTVPGLGISSTH